MCWFVLKPQGMVFESCMMQQVAGPAAREAAALASGSEETDAWFTCMQKPKVGGSTLPTCRLFAVPRCNPIPCRVFVHNSRQQSICSLLERLQMIATSLHGPISADAVYMCRSVWRWLAPRRRLHAQQAPQMKPQTLSQRTLLTRAPR